jgi:uncharacterized phage protein gp47/JayE
MADLVDFNLLFRVARDEALARNSKLTLAIIQREGTDANVLLAGAAAAAEEVLGQLQFVEAGLFLDSAVGTQLDRLVFDRYGLTRKPAAAAQGFIQFTTTVPNPSGFIIPSGTQVQTTDGIQYVTTVAASFPAATVGPIQVAIRSALAGIDQQARIGTISIVSQITGSPSDLVVTNTQATAGAADEELDDSLRNRARLFFVTARKGTKSALEAGALAVPGVVTATAFEGLDTFGNPSRRVQLVVADSFTIQLANFSTTPPPAYQVQAQALALEVQNGLNDVRAYGIQVDVIVAAVVLLPIILRLTFNAGTDIALATTRARAAAVNYCNGLAPGVTFQPTDLIDLLRPVPGLFISGQEVANPPGPVICNPTQVLRSSLELVTTSQA